MTKEDFINSVEALEADVRANPDKFENLTLDSFLSAVSRYAQDVQGYYNNTGQNVDAEVPNWKLFSDILHGASVYE